MLKVQQEPPKPKPVYRGPAWLALGFRPLFSAAIAAALLLLTAWLTIWPGGRNANAYYGMIGWHSHEMLFGYTAAVVTGFLLTAVRNWTGVNTPAGWRLGALAALWLAGRIAPWLALPAPLIALADLLFLPAAAAAIAPALWRGQSRVNRVFVPLLLAMALANLLVHLQPLGIAGTAAAGTDLMLLLVALLMTLIGGRIIPAFSGAVGADYRARSWRWIDLGAMLSLLLLIGLQTLRPGEPLTGGVALLTASIHAVRFAGWHDRRVWRTPLLWVLYSGYLWLVTGFALLGLAALGWTGANLARHAVAVGGIGVLTFGMMARVTLGHTGRPLQPPRAVEWAFGLLNLAAAARVFGPQLLADRYPFWVHLSGALWIGCFALLAWYYLPMLGRPRIDGKPG